MYVNPFWFGVLMTIVVAIMILIVIAIVNAHGEEKETESSQEEYEKFLHEITGKKFKTKVVNGFLVAEPIEDEEDKRNDHADSKPD